MKNIIALVCSLLVVGVEAEIIELAPTNMGSASSEDPFNFSRPGLYGVGGVLQGGIGVSGIYTYRNYFEFDLSVFTNATSATLKLNTYDVSADGTYTLYDMPITPSSLAFPYRPSDLYDDMGSGVSYGASFISDIQDNQYIEIVLNASAIASINASGGIWAIGGSYSANQDGQHAFGGSTTDVGNMLIVDAAPIPEPSTLAFIGIFGGGLWFVRRYFPSV